MKLSFAMLAALMALTGAACASVPEDGPAISGFPSSGELEAFAAAGKTTLVNFRSDEEMAREERDLAAEAGALGMAYHSIPVGGATPASPAQVTALQAVLDEDNSDTALFCRSGSRAAHALTAAYMRQGLSEEDAKAKTGWTGTWSDNMLAQYTGR